MMIYLNNDGDYITSDNFINCGNEQREELARYYHLPDGRELYNFLDSLDSWADIPTDVFQQLAESCGVEYDAQEEADDLMERCEEALSKEEAAEEDYKKAVEETEDWMKPENCFPNLYQDNKE